MQAARRMVSTVVRRGQQVRRSLRRADRELNQQLESDQGAYRPPKRSECHQKSWETAWDDAYSVRLQTHTWRDGKRLVDFVINAQVLTADGWVTVEYIDCCHGHCHHHARDGRNVRTIMRLDDVYDVQNAYKKAQAVIYERLRIIRGGGE